jgi:hypothetical protein
VRCGDIREREGRGNEKRGGIRIDISMKLHHWWLWEVLWAAL